MRRFSHRFLHRSNASSQSEPSLLECEYKLTFRRKTIKAAVVDAFATGPRYRDFEEPVPGEGEVLINVTACALSNFTKARASGKHPSYAVKPPFVTGFDGVGRLDDGRRVYFSFPRDPFGGMAERTVVKKINCIAAPGGVSDTTLAALVDPGFSAWAALKSRAHFAAGETVLVNGATGTAGMMAVQIAKQLGASKVIATGRNAVALERIQSLGADVTLLLQDGEVSPSQAYCEHFDSGVDVVLDYLWGSSAERLLNAAAKTQRRPLRYVQIGAASSESLTLDARVLRHSSIEMLGCSVSNVPPNEIARSVVELIGTASTADFVIDVTAYPLERIEEVWSQESATPRVVFKP